MVRGLCPRDWMRGEVGATVRAVGDVGAVGHAERVHLTRPSNPSTPRVRVTAEVELARMAGVTDGNCVTWGVHGSIYRLTH